jgi:HSP20 family protein
MYRIIRYTHPRTASLSPSLAARSALAGLESEVDRLFEAALSDFVAPATAPRFPIDLYEDKKNTYVRAELPGVSREAMSVEVVDGYLNLSATRAEPAPAGQEPARSLNLSRSIALPTEVQADKVTAAYENGVLTVTLPKQEQAKPRKINVTIN